jgi:hypothetical protein
MDRKLFPDGFGKSKLASNKVATIPEKPQPLFTNRTADEGENPGPRSFPS